MAMITARIRVQNTDTGEWREEHVPANSVGKFFAVHRAIVGWNNDTGELVLDDYSWTVTHLPSGFKAASSPYKASAMHAAYLLAELDVLWPTLTETDAKALSGPVLKQIRHIRGMARIGAMA